MKKIFTLLFGIAAAAFFSGCVCFNDYTVMPGDALNDEANMPYVARDMKIAEARKSFKKPVEIKMSTKGHRFLGNTRQYSDAGKVYFSPALRKDLMMAADAKLRSIINGMRDFQLVNTETALQSAPGATITVVENTPAVSKN